MRNLNHGINRFSTREFTYIPHRREFVAEASDFYMYEPTAIYNDSCDVGFWLTSHKTGNCIPFVHIQKMEGEETDGEFVADVYGVVPGYFPFGHKNNDLKVILFND